MPNRQVSAPQGLRRVQKSLRDFQTVKFLRTVVEGITK